MDGTHVPAALRRAADGGDLAGIALERLTYFISHETIIASPLRPGMPAWREEVFALMQRNARETASYFCVPAHQVMEVGAEVEV